MDWPLFFKDDLILGNPDSCVAICTLWTKRELITNKISKEKFCVCGNLYTQSGINYLIKNILANPKIRYIILCGSDLTGSGEALLNLVGRGIDDSGKIIGSQAYVDQSIPLNLLEKFRENIKIMDMRGKENQIENIIWTLNSLPPFMEPVFLTKPETKTEVMYSDDVGFNISGKNISETWMKILDLIMKFGEEKKTEYKIKQKELIDVVAVIEGDDEVIPQWLGITEKDLEKYYRSFFSEKKAEGVDYTYGERLFKYSLSHVPDKWAGEVESTFNQIEHVIKKLSESPYTRRAVAFTWKHEVDSDSKNPPCLTQITWNVKNGLLYQTSVFRSHDIFGAWLINAFALRKLQKDISIRLGLDVGDLVIISNSAHIYENNWDDAIEKIKRHYSEGEMRFEPDKRGYLIVSVENGEIVVQHHLPDGRKTKFEFRGNNAQSLYRRILHENLISRLDHAAYIGCELAKAEEAVKEGKKYVQDTA